MTFEKCGAGEERPARPVVSDSESVFRFIEGLVATVFCVAPADLRSRSRGPAATAFARQTAMYLPHVVLGAKLAEVGRHFGRDRTTVAHACARVEDRRDDEAMERVVSCLEAAVQRWRAGLGREGAR
jgi:chromosomal replication initiation ATPase DnaA